MPFKPVPLDYESLINQAPVWNGGTVDNETTFNADVTVNGSLTADNLLVQNGAEINGGLAVTGGMDIDNLAIVSDLNVGGTLYLGNRDVVNEYFRIKIVANEGFYFEALTGVDTWTERGYIGVVTIQ